MRTSYFKNDKKLMYQVIGCDWMEFKAKLEKIPLKVADGHYVLSFDLGKNPHIAYDVYEQYMNTPVKVEIKKFKEKRSDEANRKFWACISELADALELDNWDCYLKELKKYGKYDSIFCKKEAYAELTKVWRETEIVGERKGADGDYYEVLCFYGTSTYNTKEFARLLNGVIEDMKDMGLDAEFVKD